MNLMLRKLLEHKFAATTNPITETRKIVKKGGIFAWLVYISHDKIQEIKQIQIFYNHSMKRRYWIWISILNRCTLNNSVDLCI